jgi:DnaJ family protein C protein 8
MEIENEINSSKQEKGNNPNSSGTKTNSSINAEHLPEMDIKKLLEELVSEQTNPMTSNAQLKRLLNTNFISPYEVLIISIESTEEEIKKQYRQLSLLVHPDKCQDPRAADAFHSIFLF